MADQNDAQAIIDTVKNLAEAEVLDIERGSADECQVLVLPEGKSIHSLKEFVDEYLEAPERKQGTAAFTQLDSLIAYINRHKSEQSVVFVDDRDPKKPAIRAHFDPHGAQQAPAGRYGFGAAYHFPLSAEWVTWTTCREMNQEQFANFLEERIFDVLDPANVGEKAKAMAVDLGLTIASPSRLLELSRNLAVAVDARVSQNVNLGTGEGHIVFAEEHKDQQGAPLKVPGAFAIGIPVFRLGAPYQVFVRLRYRLGEGRRILWSLVPSGLDRVFDHAIEEAAKKVAELTQLPVFRGGV